MDADNEYTPTPCRHQDDWLDCSLCYGAAHGADTWRTCRHGEYRGECPTCDGDDGGDVLPTIE